jgi:hypothetical protein
MSHIIHFESSCYEEATSHPIWRDVMMEELLHVKIAQLDKCRIVPLNFRKCRIFPTTFASVAKLVTSVANDV